jgi:3'-phosphoadenosine 5'-phosphosulfate sulfotransferase (PAPS reductase)/FAD synthetase
LLDWSIAQVWDMHRKYGIRPNPLYFAGCKRVGCLPCIMSRKSEIKLMAKKFPERVEMIRSNEQMDEGMFHSFFARNKVPLAQRTVEITTKDGKKMKVASIDDVVRWSRTARGGKQYELDMELPNEEFRFDEDKFLGCSASMGQCE